MPAKPEQIAVLMGEHSGTEFKDDQLNPVQFEVALVNPVCSLVIVRPDWRPDTVVSRVVRLVESSQYGFLNVSNF